MPGVTLSAHQLDRNSSVYELLRKLTQDPAPLSKEQKILFEKYKECCMDMYGMAELEAFVSGGEIRCKYHC